MRALYSNKDSQRFFAESNTKPAESFRTPWRQDYARLIHSPSFRRLQGKTQVFPGHESDFYRNRLTHSLEVAQIAKSIAIRLNATAEQFSKKRFKIEPDIVEFAGLAHDLGHPPFGHNGEEALDECMRDHGGFEGNAQSLRIVSHLEKKVFASSEGGDGIPFDNDGNDLRRGLNLTYRCLGALLKYDEMIPVRAGDRASHAVMKGYYYDDKELVSAIKKNVIGIENYKGKFKTIECSIMDIADDIAYSTYDLEDNFKAGFLTPMGLFALDEEVYKSVAATIVNRTKKQYPERLDFCKSIDSDFVRNVLFTIFRDVLFAEHDTYEIDRVVDQSQRRLIVASEIQALSRTLARDGHQRVKFTSSLVQNFLSGIEVVPHNDLPQLHNVRLSFETFLFVETLKNITYHAIIRSGGLQVVEYRGKDIVSEIFKALSSDDGTRLLPDDFRSLCRGSSESVRMRAICDFIAGMTDRYAFEFYGRLYGSNNLTIHKPL
jgi:dGTPase